MHFYTDDQPFVFICIKHIESLPLNNINKLRNICHVFVYYSEGNSKNQGELNTTKERQLSKLLEFPEDYMRIYTIYTITPNRRIMDVKNIVNFLKFDWNPPSS